MKPVLVGIDNPHPGTSALSVYVPNGSGQRLFAMMQKLRPSLTTTDFMDGFVRVNMEDYRTPAEIPAEGTLILLGNRVRDWFGASPIIIHPQVILGRRVRYIPHPSGVNIYYNDADARTAVGMMLLEELGKW